MEHAPISPPATRSEAFPLAELPEGLQDAFALQGLRSLLFAPIPKVARALAGFDRDQLGAAIEVMIALLDASEPDPDLEDDDPSGDPLDLGEIDARDRDLLPLYGDDQTRGPINEEQEHRAAMAEERHALQWGVDQPERRRIERVLSRKLSKGGRA